MATKKTTTSKATKPSALIDDKLSATQFIRKLSSIKDPSNNVKFFHEKGGSKFLNVRMAKIFSTAKAFSKMAVSEINKLFDSEYYEARMGAVSIMDFQARNKKITPEERKVLYELYLKRHDRINNWDLVDRSAPYVVGGYLFDKSRVPLYKLAKSKSVLERRTAIVSTYFFIRQNDIEDTFKIAEMLIHDKDDSINKAVGSWIREAGKRDPEKLTDFLDRYSATMPRVTLRYAIEKLEKRLKDVYMKAAKEI